MSSDEASTCLVTFAQAHLAYSLDPGLPPAVPWAPNPLPRGPALPLGIADTHIKMQGAGVYGTGNLAWMQLFVQLLYF